MAGYVLKLVGLNVVPWNTPQDGQYLRQITPGSGRPGEMAVIVTTSDKTLAKNYATQADALAERYTSNPNEPWRPDGEANYPLARFNLLVEAG